MFVLNEKQALAAASPYRYVEVEAIPGSGKTVVAVERFGVLRYSSDDARGVLALAFNVATVAALKSRIVERWGASCVAFPHEVCTFDKMYRELFDYLVNVGHVGWPGEFDSLDVRKDYRGLEGYSCNPNCCLSVTLDPSNAVSICELPRRFKSESVGGFQNVCYLERVLRSGIISYEHLHRLVDCVCEDENLSAIVVDWLKRCYRSVIVDESYDMNSRNLSFVDLCYKAGLSITIIGDRWQAIYKWRDAEPFQVASYVEEPSRGFVSYRLEESYRFKQSSLAQAAVELRNGGKFTLEIGSSVDIDVALASKWQSLWCLGDNILPLSFGALHTVSDALSCLFLNFLLERSFGIAAFNVDQALHMLNLSPESLLPFDRTVAELVLRRLYSCCCIGPEFIEYIAAQCRAIGWSDALIGGLDCVELEKKLALLARRSSRAKLIPGMTVNQAKGREWDRVGVWFSKMPEVLDVNNEHHRKIYVAVTRSRLSTCLLEKR